VTAGRVTEDRVTAGRVTAGRRRFGIEGDMQTLPGARRRLRTFPQGPGF